jgi:outer membrane biogenesis lipoprotein LolB
VNKIELLHALRSVQGEWAQLIADIQPDVMIQPGVVGDWSVKDVVAHITWAERETVGMLQARALVGSELWQLPQDERNTVVYEENRDRSLQDVLTEAEAVHQELLGVIESIAEDDLLHATWFDSLPGDWPPYRVVEANATDHYRHHLADLKRWLGQR